MDKVCRSHRGEQIPYCLSVQKIATSGALESRTGCPHDLPISRAKLFDNVLSEKSSGSRYQDELTRHGKSP